MISPTFLRQALLLLALVCAAGPGLADDDCDVPVQQWQSRDAVRRMAAERGWQLQRLKIDDGCYEVRGIDAEGRAFKAQVHPGTLAIVKIKRKAPERKRKRDGDRDRPPAHRLSPDR